MFQQSFAMIELEHARRRGSVAELLGCLLMEVRSLDFMLVDSEELRNVGCVGLMACTGLGILVPQCSYTHQGDIPRSILLSCFRAAPRPAYIVFLYTRVLSSKHRTMKTSRLRNPISARKDSGLVLALVVAL